MLYWTIVYRHNNNNNNNNNNNTILTIITQYVNATGLDYHYNVIIILFLAYIIIFKTPCLLFNR